MSTRFTTTFGRLAPQPPDSLLALIGAYRGDPRPGKLDLGLGVYRDAKGDTPVFGAVKAAERLLLESQQTKTYLGAEGDVGFLAQLQPIIFGSLAGDGFFGIQTPGGVGASGGGPTGCAPVRGRTNLAQPSPHLQVCGGRDRELQLS